MNEPINSFAHLFERLKTYVTLQIDIVTLTIGEKIALFLAKLFTNSIIVFFSLFVFLFASLAAAFALSACLGSYALGFLAVSLLYLLLLGVFTLVKRKYVEKPMIDMLIRMFFGKKSGDKSNE